jgi:hypothetical protein
MESWVGGGSTEQPLGLSALPAAAGEAEKAVLPFNIPIEVGYV